MSKATTLEERLELYRNLAIQKYLAPEVAKLPYQSDAQLRDQLEYLKLDIADDESILRQYSTKGRLSKRDIDFVETVNQGKIRRGLIAHAIEEELMRCSAPLEVAGDG